MTDMHVGDVVVNVSDRSVFGEVVQATESAGGLHPPPNSTSGAPTGLNSLIAVSSSTPSQGLT